MSESQVAGAQTEALGGVAERQSVPMTPTSSVPEPNEASRQQIREMQAMWQQISELTATNESMRNIVSDLMAAKTTPQTKEEESLTPEQLEIRKLQEAVGYLSKLQKDDIEERQKHAVSLEEAILAQQEAEQTRQVESTIRELDESLAAEGYPDFAAYRSLVREEIENDPGWSHDPEVFKQQLEQANNPEFWAYIYKTKVIPKLNSYAPKFRRMAEHRTETNEGDWSVDDYVKNRQATSIGGYETV